MKKNVASSYKMILRLARPLFHIVLLLVIFRIGYTVRQSTDLIPWLQLTIPAFNLTETIRFAVSAIAIFVGACFLLGVYDLFKPLHGYYRKFLLARVRWLVCMTFLALFGNGFIFTDGISRFLILWSALCGFIALSIFDIFWNNINSYLEKEHPYKIVVIYKTQAQYEQFSQDISGYKIYELIPVQEKEYDGNRRRGAVDIVIAVGSYSTNLLQTIADHARNHGKTFYHIPESYFLEDLIAQPQRIGPVVGRAYSSSPLDGWLRVLKRFCDFVCSLLAIIVLSPVFLLIALLIKIDSKGPVFYIQQRVGRKGVPFRFIKFRSMYTHLSTGKNYG
ncbi:sugar transferase [Patescibacteria group bacterium]|nr:sugar transferase [Patescibacteria group bacterium]